MKQHGERSETSSFSLRRGDYRGVRQEIPVFFLFMYALASDTSNTGIEIGCLNQRWRDHASWRSYDVDKKAPNS
jgi:hypothetical protein